MQLIVGIICLGLFGLALISVGVYLVLGLGAGFISSGVSVLLLAAFIRSGIKVNG